MENNELMTLTEKDLLSKIYMVRGVHIMLDVDLASIYGYSTKSFNRQVNNNLNRFDEDFRFQLTDTEFEILRCKNCTSRWGGTRYLPYAFTELGIYMLMTVLKGELAVRQSKKLIRLFQQMKDYILQRQNILPEHELVRLSIQTQSNTDNIRQIQQRVDDLSEVFQNFTNSDIKKDYLFYNGQTVEAAIAYGEIYSFAKRSIHIIDNYISLKTLILLKSVAEGVRVVIFSDNVNHNLHQTEYLDFQQEYPNVDVTLKTSCGIYHDRYIIIDNGSLDEKIFHCGGSSKDGGKRITSITLVSDVTLYQNIILSLQDNPVLQL